MRIDVPCASLGLAPPPCPMQIWLLSTGDRWRLMMLCPPGRPPHAKNWLERHGLGGAALEPGLAPRCLWLDFEHLPKGLPAFLLDRSLQRIELTAEGTASIFVEDRLERTQALVGRIRSQLPEAYARDVVFSRPSDLLTPRQKEALSVAVACGYYEVPRRATLRELAATMGLSPGAASELLRRAERTIITGMFDAASESASTLPSA